MYNEPETKKTRRRVIGDHTHKHVFTQLSTCVYMNIRRHSDTSCLSWLELQTSCPRLYDDVKNDENVNIFFLILMNI